MNSHSLSGTSPSSWRVCRGFATPRLYSWRIYVPPFKFSKQECLLRLRRSRLRRKNLNEAERVELIDRVPNVLRVSQDFSPKCTEGLVPGAGLEPARVSPPGSKPGASAIPPSRLIFFEVGELGRNRTSKWDRHTGFTARRPEPIRPVQLTNFGVPWWCWSTGPPGKNRELFC